MKTLTTAVLAMLLCAGVASAKEKKGVSVSFDSNDPRTRLATRHETSDARLAITTRHGEATLMLVNDVVAVQLSDATLSGAKPEEDENFLVELLAAGVRLAIGKSVEYPIAHIRSAEIRGGVLVLTNDQGKPVFDNVKVNGDTVMRDISVAEATRFVNTFRLVKAGR